MGVPEGVGPATSTNYSVRLPEQAAPAICAITSSGAEKDVINVSHILSIDQSGQPLNGQGLKPSAETALHLMLYRAVGAGAVLHIHSLAAAVLSQWASHQGHLRLSGWELLKGLQGITTHDCEVGLPVFPNSQDLPALAAQIEAHLMAHRPSYGFLLAGHGLYTWGKDVREAKRHLEVLEFVLRCEWEGWRNGHAASARQERLSD